MDADAPIEPHLELQTRLDRETHRAEAESRIRAILGVLHPTDGTALNWVVEQLLKECDVAAR